VSERTGRGVLLAAMVVVVVVAGALWLGSPSDRGPLDPRSHEPGGTSALVALLRELGASVELDVGLPDQRTDVALVLRDRFGRRRWDQLETWVRRGGILVVVDPGAPLAPSVAGGELQDDGVSDVDDPGELGLDLHTEVDARQCDIEALDHPDITTADVYPGPVGYHVEDPAESCFGDGEVAYVVATPEGEGSVVALGGSGIITNRALDEADNAPVIAALVAPTEGTRVAVLDHRAPAAGDGGEKTLSDLVPESVKRALLQLGLAFLLYVAWRSRRLAKPVAEPQPVKVAGSELVAAVGGLLERSKSPQHAADVLRADLRRELVVRLGLPADIPPETLAQILAERSALDAARLQAALGPGSVASDRDLVVIAQLIDAVRKEVFDHVGS
jgi:hypothetical protein